MIIEVRFAAIKEGASIVQAVADQARLVRLRRQLTAEGVIEVDHPATQIWPGEQLGLGCAISLHAAVVIEVITRQVGEHRNVELQCGDTALVQTMGRHFHGHGAGTGLLERRESGLHADRIGRCVLALLQRAMETVAQSTNDAARLAE